MVMNELENFTGDHNNYTTLFTYIPINVVRKFVFKHFTTALTKSIFDCNMHRLALEDGGRVIILLKYGRSHLLLIYLHS